MGSESAFSLAVQYALPMRTGRPTPPARAQCRRWVQAALEKPMAITLRWVGEAEGRALNRDFRAKDYATNVLTFPYGNSADIIVCDAVTRREARQLRIAYADHCAHLVIHGVLHAQGYDHETDSEASLMEAREIALLRRFRIASPYALPV
jgi:probable rRNA maturation factor